jgi:hypothetical protein
MSTIRIDKEHEKLLDKLIAHLTLRGQKISKKELIGRLIENATISEGIINDDERNSLVEDLAWKGLEETFNLGISDLSENVDKLLYEINGED